MSQELCDGEPGRPGGVTIWDPAGDGHGGLNGGGLVYVGCTGCPRCLGMEPPRKLLARDLSTPESRALWAGIDKTVARIEVAQELAKTHTACPTCQQSLWAYTAGAPLGPREDE